MKKNIFIVLFLLALVLAGCGKKNNYDINVNNFESFYDVTPTFIIDDVSFRYKVTFEEKEEFNVSDLLLSFELHFKIHKNDGSIIYYEVIVADLEKTFYEKLVMEESIYKVELYYFYLTKSSGSVTSKNEIILNNKEYIHLDKTPKSQSLVKEDEVLDNELLLTELNKKLDLYDVENQNSFSITQWNYVTLKLDGKIMNRTFDSQYSYLQADPFYVHTNVSSVNTIIQESENGYLMAAYDVAAEKHNDRTIIYPLYLEDSEEITDGVTDGIEDYSIDATKMKIEVEGNSYIVNAFIKDIIDEDTYDMLVQMYTELNLDTTIIDETIITVTYTFKENYVEIDTYIAIEIENIETIVENITTIKFESVDFVDIFDEELFIFKPNQIISNAIPLSKLDVKYEIPFNTLDGPHYYKFDLTKGQYDLEVFGRDYSKFKIYNEFHHEIDFNIFKEKNTYNDNITMTFVIHEDGIYILEYEKYLLTNEYQFMLSKLNYETVFNKNQMQELTSSTYNLDFEGTKDIIGYYAKSLKNSVLKIKKLENDSNHLKVMYFKDDMMQINEISTYSDVYIPFSRNMNFYFFDDEFDINNNYQIDIEVVTSSIYQSSNYNNMVILTDSFTETPIIMGELMDNSYLKFRIEEKATYKLLFEEIVGYVPSVNLYTKNNEYIDDISEYDQMELEVGDYYIEASYKYLLYIFNVAIVKVD